MIPPTPAQLRALSREAGVAGDLETVGLCARALEGDVEALAVCNACLDDARALIARHETAARDLRLAYAL